MGTLHISRADNYYGSARRLVIYVDGAKVAKPRSDDVIRLELANGEHTVRARMDWVTCRPIAVKINDDRNCSVEFSLPWYRLPLTLFTPWWGFVAHEL